MVTILTPSNPSILILGAGWTSTFLIPLLTQEGVSYAATTTTGRDGTLPFRFSYDASTGSLTAASQAQLAALPSADTVLVTFPLTGLGQSAALHRSYTAHHHHRRGADGTETQFIQLGSSGIFSRDGSGWITRGSTYDAADPRAVAEDELLTLGGCVLDLAGLWGAQRHPRHWVARVAATKAQLEDKRSLHLVHGSDVARGILGVHRRFEAARGQRFIVTDLCVHDWWALILGFAGEMLDGDAEHGKERSETLTRWVGELMREQEVRALPRSMEQLGRCYDTREFWETIGTMPVRSRV